MAARTNTEAVRDLERHAATLAERLENAVGELERYKAALQNTNEAVTRLRIDLAVLTERSDALLRSMERMQQREVKLALLVLGSFLTFVANLAVVILQRLL